MDSFQALINIYTPERERVGVVAEMELCVHWHDRDGKDIWDKCNNDNKNLNFMLHV